MADENDINNRLDQIDSILGKYQNTAVSQTQAYINVLQKRAAGERITANDLKSLSNEVNRASDAFKKMRADFYAAGSSAIGLTAALGRGKDGFDLFNDAIDIAVKATKGMFNMLSGVMAKLNPIAGAVAGVVGELGQGVAEIAGDIGKYLVNTFKEGYQTFTTLSKVGAIGADGIVGMAKQFETLELPMSKFAALVTSNSNTLAMLGTTVSDAANTMVSTAGAMKSSGIDQQLRNLGYTSEEIADSMISYAELQRLMGQQAFNDQARLAAGTAEYAKELDTIARLTGKSREETQKALQAQMRETRFRNKIQAMMAAGQVEAAQELQRAVLVQTQMGNTQMAKAIMDASTGIYNSPEAISAVTSMRGFAQNVDGLTKGMSESDFTQNLQNSSADAVKRFNMLGQAVGDATVVTRLNTEQNNLATAKQGKYAEARAKAEEQLNKAMTQPNQQTSDLTQAAKNLESAAALMQATFMTTETMPALMKEASVAMKNGVVLLTNAIKNFGGDKGYTTQADVVAAQDNLKQARADEITQAEKLADVRKSTTATTAELQKAERDFLNARIKAKQAYENNKVVQGLASDSPTREIGAFGKAEQRAAEKLNVTLPTTYGQLQNMQPINPAGPATPAPAPTANPAQALPPKAEASAQPSSTTTSMNVNGMQELIAASTMQGQKLDRIEAALKKGNSITANS